MTSKKSLMQTMAVIFGLISFILFIVSINRIDFGFGSIEYANVPVMMLAVGSAVICAANIIGSFILADQEERFEYIRAELHRNAQTVKRNEKADQTVQTPVKVTEKGTSIKNDTHGPEINIASFSKLIGSMTSSVEIRDLWLQKGYNRYPEYSNINQEIMNAANVERMYGRNETDVAELKQKIIGMIGE